MVPFLAFSTFVSALTLVLLSIFNKKLEKNKDQCTAIKLYIMEIIMLNSEINELMKTT